MTDEQAIADLYQQLLTYWNKRDAAAYAALFTDDAAVVGFDGSQMHGRAHIAEEIGRIFADHVTAAYVGKVRGIRFLASGVALLRAVVGMVPPGQADLNPAANAVQALVAVEQGGRWHIELFQNTPAQFHGRPELAEALTNELRELL